MSFFHRPQEFWDGWIGGVIFISVLRLAIDLIDIWIRKKRYRL